MRRWSSSTAGAHWSWASFVKTVSRSPRAGWGLTVLEPDGSRLRLIGVDGEVLLGPIAITACSVPTLRSMQFKGDVVEIVPLTEADRAKVEQYSDDFFQDITDTDGVPRHLIERVRPPEKVACTVVVEEMFDQTPGPRAGEALS